MAPRCTTDRCAVSASAKVANPHAVRSFAAGAGCSAEPGLGDHAEGALAADEHLVQVGADRLAGEAARRDLPPVGEDDVEADDDVLDLPVAARHLTGAAAGEPSSDRRQVHRLRPVPDGHAVVGLAASPRTASRTCRRGRRRRGSSRRRRRCPTVPVRSRTTPPWTGTLPPSTPLRPPAAVTGTRARLQTAMTAATSAAVSGRHTTSARAATSPVVAQHHGERPPVAAKPRRASPASVVTDAHALRRRSTTSSATSTRVAVRCGRGVGGAAGDGDRRRRRSRRRCRRRHGGRT